VISPALPQTRDKLLVDLFDHTSDLIQVISLDGQVLLVNRAWCDALGYNETEALALNVFTLIVEDCRDHCQQVLAALLAGQARQRIVCAFRRRDGGRLDLEGELEVALEQGKPVLIRGILRDISERRASEQAMQELNQSLEQRVQQRTAALVLSESRLEEAQRVAGVGHWELDITSGVLHWSDEICRLSGFEPGEVTPSYALFLETVHPDDREMIQNCYQESLHTSQPSELIYRLVRPDGQWRYIRSRWTNVFDDAGHVLRSLGTAHDITEIERSRRDLLASEAKLRSLFELSSLGLALIDCSGHVHQANQAFRDLFQTGDQDGSLLNYFSFVPEALRSLERERLARLVHETDALAYVLEMQTGQGATIIAQVKGQRMPASAAAAAEPLIWLLLDDISNAIARETDLRNAANVFRFAKEGIIITDPRGTIRDVNAAFSEITGYQRDHVIGLHTRLLKSGYHVDDFYATMWRCLAERGYWSGEVINRASDGSLFEVLETISAVKDEQGYIGSYVALLTDIRQIKQQQQQLQRLAHFDQLTGLPNRLLLAERLGRAITVARSRGQSLAICYLDLDGFKPINDRHGHAAGDRLLKEVAARLQTTIGEGDVAARLGGDEFVLVLHLDSAPGAGIAVLDRLLALLPEPVLWEGHELRVTASVGVTLFLAEQGGDEEPDQLLRQADQAMYQAKRLGRNRYSFYRSDSSLGSQGSGEGVERLRHAIEQGEFELHYQPMIDLHSESVVGVEALIRWRHPDQGLLLPDRFLPFISRGGLAIELSEWVLSTGLAQFQRWREQGLLLPVSLNISHAHLEDPRFLDRLVHRLAAIPALPAGALCFEIVETEAFENLEALHSVFEALVRLGIELALDDFGTGHSTLTYLRDLPATRLKIDKTFVHGMPTRRKDRAIVRGIIALAEAFELQLVAEGVEDVQMIEALRSLGVERVQGFHFARPMPADQISSWILAREGG
jgi:diguanylate cyclase (GGDEF)-like protein/PAS domain S-box-containing protein